MPVNDVALLERRQTQLARLRLTTATQLSRLWLALKSYDGPSRWLALATPVLTAGQHRAFDLQAAYLTVLLGRFDFDRDELLAAATPDLTEPFIALGRALNAGADHAAAVEAGRLRAEGVAESGVQWAARAANSAVEADGRIVGWRRTLHVGACDWCQTIATQRYRTAESASKGHQRCNCGVDPIIGDRDPGQVINARLTAEHESRPTETVDQ